MSEKSPSLLFRPWNSTKELGFQPPDLPLGSTISYFSDIFLDNLEVPLQGIMPDCLTTALICKAREIAQIEPKFDKRVYRPFIKTWKRFLRYADKHEILQIGQIQGNNQLFITGKNKKPSARKREPRQGS